MLTFKLFVATPETELFNDEVISVVLPGEKGFFEILANHAPIISVVRKGALEIVDKNQKKHSIEVPRGFFEFYKNQGVLLCRPPPPATVNEK